MLLSVPLILAVLLLLAALHALLGKIAVLPTNAKPRLALEPTPTYANQLSTVTSVYAHHAILTRIAHLTMSKMKLQELLLKVTIATRLVPPVSARKTPARPHLDVLVPKNAMSVSARDSASLRLAPPPPLPSIALHLVTTKLISASTHNAQLALKQLDKATPASPEQSAPLMQLRTVPMRLVLAFPVNAMQTAIVRMTLAKRAIKLPASVRKLRTGKTKELTRFQTSCRTSCFTHS